MDDEAHEATIEVVGTLHHEQIEGGFWTIDAEGDGTRWVLGRAAGVAGLVDGARVLVRGRARDDLVDMFMAGRRLDPASIEPIPPGHG